MKQAQPLPVVDDITSQDSLFTSNGDPIFRGGGDEDLACGGCGAILAAGVNSESLYANLGTFERVIAGCGCGTKNLLVSNRRVRPRGPAGTS